MGAEALTRGGLVLAQPALLPVCWVTLMEFLPTRGPQLLILINSDFDWTNRRLSELLEEPAVSAKGALGALGLCWTSVPLQHRTAMASHVPRALTQALLLVEVRNGAGPAPHSAAPLPLVHRPCYPALMTWLRATACPWLIASGQVPCSGALLQTSVLPHRPPPPPAFDTYRRVSCLWRL